VNKNLNHRERSEQKFEAQFQANEGTKLKKNKNKTNDGVSLLNLSWNRNNPLKNTALKPIQCLRKKLKKKLEKKKDLSQPELTRKTCDPKHDI